MSYATKVIRVRDQSEFPKSNHIKNKPASKLLEKEILHQRMITEAFMAKLFASISSIKASYAQLQSCQTPYDVDGIQAADQTIVSEFKYLSELKQCHAKDHHLDDPDPPETALLLADIKEQKCILRTYGITRQKLISQFRLKDSEITFLEEKLDEANKENKMLEKRINSSSGGSISVPNSLNLSTLNVNHFRKVLDQTVKHIRRFVRLMIGEMEVIGWDLDAAANAVQPGITLRQPTQKCFALESFVCREMFNGFNYPGFTVHLAKHRKQQRLFLDRFNELKSFKTRNYLSQRPKSTFARFCCSKYLQLIHPEMESSLFGNLNQRKLVIGGDHYPETAFFSAFSEMAKRVWLLHCLAFSFEPEAPSIFQVAKGCRFSEVYMQCVNGEEQAFLSSETDRPAPRVAFTVVPGFSVGKTIIQCQVYLSS